jgi:hypothetical protein
VFPIAVPAIGAERFTAVPPDGMPRKWLRVRRDRRRDRIGRLGGHGKSTEISTKRPLVDQESTMSLKERLPVDEKSTAGHMERLLVEKESLRIETEVLRVDRRSHSVDRQTLSFERK